MGTCPRRSGPAHVVAALAFVAVSAGASSVGAQVAPAGWYAGDPHVHTNCGSAPQSVDSLHGMMAENNLSVISVLADMGNGEVQNPTTDLPLVTGLDVTDYTDRIVHWDATS